MINMKKTMFFKNDYTKFFFVVLYITKNKQPKIDSILYTKKQTKNPKKK